MRTSPACAPGPRACRTAICGPAESTARGRFPGASPTGRSPTVDVDPADPQTGRNRILGKHPEITFCVPSGGRESVGATRVDTGGAGPGRGTFPSDIDYADIALPDLGGGNVPSWVSSAARHQRMLASNRWPAQTSCGSRRGATHLRRRPRAWAGRCPSPERAPRRLADQKQVVACDQRPHRPHEFGATTDIWSCVA